MLNNDTDFTREENERWFDIMWDLRKCNMTKASSPKQLEPLQLTAPTPKTRNRKVSR
jgi:hypothetical protein